jgi:uncharacterized phage protein (TIGR01671 family)
MREYKFRAWDKENKEMLYQGSNTTHNNGVMDCRIVFDELGFGVLVRLYGEVRYEYRDNCELMQYTGMTDKNGKEIYEGDILRLWRSVGEKGQLRGEYAYLLPVEYCELWTQFVVVDKPNKIQMGIWKEFGAFEVIGNIYENPELLKEVE